MEIHGCDPDHGLRVFTEKALQRAVGAGEGGEPV
jgi:hypothetical protein